MSKVKFTPKAILIPTISLFVVAAIVALLLALTNSITVDKIAEQNTLKQNDSCKIVLPEATDFTSGTLDDITYYTGTDDGGNTVGYAIITSEKGYGGEVEVMTGITTAGNVSGVVILSQNETPGLGANAEKEDFRDQYKTETPPSNFVVSKESTETTDETVQIQAMTGATITSKAVTQAVNDALNAFNQIKGV